MIVGILDKYKDAVFSPGRVYRYFLIRELRKSKKPSRVLFVLLNPSTADETKNDPTVERCQRRAWSLGFDVMMVCNIFALRSTMPEYLYKADDPIGVDNNAWIRFAASNADLVICGWGMHGRHLDRGVKVLDLIRNTGRKTYALKINEGGIPGHPLYLKYSLQPKEF